MLASCGATSTLQKDIKPMQIRFKPLTRNDITLVGNLEASSTVAYKMKGVKKILEKPYRNDLKEGLINKSEAIEVLYFAPGNGEVVTGSLYDNELFNSVYGSQNMAGSNMPKSCGIGAACLNSIPGYAIIKKIIEDLKGGAMTDPGMSFGYYALVEKYPDVDYFINVRFERKTVVSGGIITETVTVKSDGIKLKTD